KSQLQEGFAVDAWLANWNLLRADNSAIRTDSEGKIFRSSIVSSLRYDDKISMKRPAAFSKSVSELKMFTSGFKGYGNVFSGMTPEQQRESADKVTAITDEEIDSLVDSVDFPDKDATEFKAILKGRRDFIDQNIDAEPVAVFGPTVDGVPVKDYLAQEFNDLDMESYVPQKGDVVTTSRGVLIISSEEANDEGGWSAVNPSATKS